jgi:hypothetical protein
MLCFILQVLVSDSFLIDLSFAERLVSERASCFPERLAPAAGIHLTFRGS